MKSHKICVGRLMANCYILFCKDSKRAVIIDPGAEPEKILAFVKKNELEVLFVINTHSHLDHAGANQAIKSVTGAEVIAHEADLPLMAKRKLPAPDKTAADEDLIRFGDEQLQVMHTPGHSPGSISLLSKDNKIYTGDLVFYGGGFGTTSLEGGSFKDLRKSVNRLVGLPKETTICPGHGPEFAANSIEEI
jgi:glyoxylase-like metal-dependent hydrolase (beta-lactamase superfamily II)